MAFRLFDCYIQYIVLRYTVCFVTGEFKPHKAKQTSSYQTGAQTTLGNVYYIYYTYTDTQTHTHTYIYTHTHIYFIFQVCNYIAKVDTHKSVNVKAICLHRTFSLKMSLTCLNQTALQAKINLSAKVSRHALATTESLTAQCK